MIRTTRRRPRRRGVAAVEAALTISILLTLLLGLLQIGWLLTLRQLVRSASREAARAAIAGTYTKSTDEIRAVALEMLNFASLSNVEVRVYRSDTLGNELGPWSDAGFGQAIAVHVDAETPSFVPGLGIFPETIHLEALSVQRSEGD